MAFSASVWRLEPTGSRAAPAHDARGECLDELAHEASELRRERRAAAIKT